MFGGAVRGNLVFGGPTTAPHEPRRFPVERRPSVTHVPTRGGRRLRIGRYDFTIKTGRADGAGHAVVEVTVPAGAGNFLHRHPCEETMYVLAGDFELFGDDGDERRRAGPGAVMHVPANAAHGFVNVGDTDGRLLVVAPVAQEALFEDLAGAMADASSDARVAAVFAHHRVQDLVRPTLDRSRS